MTSGSMQDECVCGRDFVPGRKVLRGTGWGSSVRSGTESSPRLQQRWPGTCQAVPCWAGGLCSYNHRRG